MLVSRVSSVKSNSSNIVPTRVATRKTGANPSFGVYFFEEIGRVVKEFLPPHEEHLYNQMMSHAIIMSGPDTVKRNTDLVCILTAKRAFQLRDWHRAKVKDPTIPMPIDPRLFAWPWLKNTMQNSA